MPVRCLRNIRQGRCLLSTPEPFSRSPGRLRRGLSGGNLVVGPGSLEPFSRSSRSDLVSLSLPLTPGKWFRIAICLGFPISPGNSCFMLKARLILRKSGLVGLETHVVWQVLLPARFPNARS